MDTTTGVDGITIRVGGQARADLLRELQKAGVQLNTHAETLLARPEFDAPRGQSLRIVERTVAELGLPEGGGQSQVFAAAQSQDLALCPLVTGPYLRLAHRQQATAPDSVLCAGRAPTGAIHVASAPVSADVEVPKGFYLRVVDDQLWLRGYRCDEAYVWPAETRLAFCLPA